MTEITQAARIRTIRLFAHFPEVHTMLMSDDRYLIVVASNTELREAMLRDPDAKKALARLRMVARSLEIATAEATPNTEVPRNPLNLAFEQHDPVIATRDAFLALIPGATDPTRTPQFTPAVGLLRSNPRSVIMFGETADTVQDAVQTLSAQAPTVIQELIANKGKFTDPTERWMLELQHEFFTQCARDIVRPVCEGAVNYLMRKKATLTGTTRPEDITQTYLDELLGKNTDIGAQFLIDKDRANFGPKATAKK